MSEQKKSHKLHLVMVCNSLKADGGVANVFRNHIHYLSEYFDITAMTTEGSVDGVDYDLVKVERPELFWMRRLGHVLREWWVCKQYYTALENVHKKKNIDFIIFHSHTGLAIAGLKFRSRHRCGLACVTHGDIFTRPKGTYDLLLTKLYQWATLLSYKKSDLIIALSPFMAQCAKSKGAHQSTIKIIPNGVGMVPDIPKSSDIADVIEQRNTKLKLLYVGRLSVEKDPITLINALNLIQNDLDVSLTVVGDGALLTRCKNLCEKLKISDCVVFKGHVEKSEVEEIYQNHDIFCITSISDPLPTVVLEAMSRGLPVIGSNIDGIPFMVEDNKTGILFDSGDQEGLAQAIRKLGDDAMLRMQMGRLGKNRVREEFSWPVIAKNITHEITEVCGKIVP